MLPGDTEKNNDDNINYDDEDMDFLRDFQAAKVEKLGVPIPVELSDEEQKAVAENAANDFLAAMAQVKKDFQKSKDDLDGDADAAIDMLKSQWDQEERLREDVEDDDVFGEFE